mmetsp:Transcript_20626/g.35770  ORF Transcript_20626/g.35770 Transcript_20626/m.35770 type:complete len:291 (+) Transcript_20626:412-1284(+)
MIVSVHSLRGHEPACLVRGSVHARQLQSMRVLASRHNIFEVLPTHDLHAAVVQPLIGETDLHFELLHFPHRLHARLFAHPFHFQQALAQGVSDRLNNLQSALLGITGEVLGHIQLAQLLAQSALQALQGALPPGLLLHGTLELLLEEPKLCVHKGSGEMTSVAVHRVKAQIVHQCLRAMVFIKNSRQSGHGIHRCNVDIPQYLHWLPTSFKVLDPIKANRRVRTVGEVGRPGQWRHGSLRQFCHRHLVERQQRIAGSRARQVCVSNAGFKDKHGLGGRKTIFAVLILREF